MKKPVLVIGVLCTAALAAAAGFLAWSAQRADYGWRPAIAHPAFVREHPRVLFDEGHNNASTAGPCGRYYPFGRLLRADGYALERGHGATTARALDGVRVLVIANPSGAPRPQCFGINLPVPTQKRRSDAAFAPAEIEAIRDWVARGGALLLIADHAPFGQAAASLAQAFGVAMHQGFVEVPGETSDPLLFSSANGRLGVHPITTGTVAAERVSRVETFTGQSLDGPPGAAILLALPPTAQEAVPDGHDDLVERPAGGAQGLAFEYGRGRVVVLGEAAMATAQVYRGGAFGMNAGSNDNQRFVRNAMRWLAGPP